MQREKRIHPRIEVGWPVTMMTAEVDIDGEIENISAEGEPLWIGAEVVRTNVTLTPDPGPAPIGMGVRFTTISEENRQFLANVLSEHIKPEYDT
jgi:hypothetical protein